MPLSGLDRIAMRPKGGVVKVEFVSARDFAGAEHDPSRGCFTSFQTFAAPVEWVFREDRARYLESLAGEGQGGLVRHTLTMEVPAGVEARRAVDILRTFSGQGITAIITLASGERLIAGYSVRFGTGYPLRIAKIESSSGATTADFPSVELILESVDADLSMPVE